MVSTGSENKKIDLKVLGWQKFINTLIRLDVILKICKNYWYYTSKEQWMVADQNWWWGARCKSARNVAV